MFEYHSFQISLTEANLVESPFKNRYRYTLPSTVNFKTAKLALNQANIFYSWRNITTRFENNSFSYIWNDGSGSSTHVVSLPDGYYTVSNLNSFLQSILISNGHYLVNPEGENVYYLEIQSNSTDYSIQLNTYAFPDALPTGWSNPEGLSFPLSPETGQFVILDNNFQKIIGFNDQTLPSTVQSTTQSFTSDFTPQLDPVKTIFVACDLVDNRYSNPSSLLYPFSAAGSGGYGALISVEPTNLLYLDIKEGLYQSFEVTLLDQEYRDVEVIDPNLVIQLSFLVKKE